MNKSHTIRPRRFQIKRKGELSYDLTYGERRMMCLIQDISEKGMFAICNDDLKIGQDLKVSFELEPGLNFEARITVRFFDNGCFGAEITEVDPIASRHLKEFLENHYAGQLGLHERRSRA